MALRTLAFLLLALPLSGAGPADSPGLVVEGIVRAWEGRRPVAGARVSLFVPHSDLERVVVLGTTETDARGYFRYEAPAFLGAERIFVKAEKAGLIPNRSERFRGAGYWWHEIFLDQGQPVQGRVVGVDPERISAGFVAARCRGKLRSRWRLAQPLEADGSFSFEAGEGPLQVMVGIPGLGASGPQEFPPPWTDLELDLGPLCDVRGRVVDPEGRGIPGVAVQHSLFEGRVTLGTTDSEGAFTVRAWAQESPHLTFEHPAYLRTTEDWPLAALTEPVEVALDPLREVSFRLVDATGEPVVVGRIEGGQRRNRAAWAWDTTRQGYVGWIGPDPVSGSLEIPHYDDPELTWEGGRDPLDLGTLRLQRSNELRIRVVGPEGRPVKAASVSLSSPDKNRRKVHQGWTHWTDGRGEWSLGGIESQQVQIQVGTPEFATLTQEHVMQPGVQELTLQLSGGGRLTFQVRDEAGEPVEEVRARLQRRGPRGVEGAEGKWTFSSIPEGVAWELELRKKGFLEQSIPIAAFELNEARDLGTLVLSWGAVVSGMVQDPDGNPIPGALVRGGELRVHTGPTGRYRVTGLTARDGTLKVQKEGYFHVAALERGQRDDRYEIEVREGEEHELNVVLQAAASYRARVVNDDGSPAEITCELQVLSGRGYPMTARSRDGEIFFDAVPPGPVRLSKGHGWDERSVLGWAASVEELPTEWVIPRTCELLVQWSPELGQDEELFLRIVSDEDETEYVAGRHVNDDPSEFTYRGLPAGDFRARVEVPGREPSPWKPVKLDPDGDVPRLVVRLGNARPRSVAPEEPRTPLAVWVGDSAGRPVASAHVSSGRFRGQTDATGRVVLEPAGGPRRISVQASGHGRFEATVPAGTAEWDIVLEPEARVHLQLFDPDGHPVTKGNVRAHPADGRPGRLPTYAKCGPRGSATLEGLTGGTYLVRFRDEGKSWERAWSIEPRVEQSLEWRLAPFLSVSGSVSWGGRPAPAGRVILDRFDLEERFQAAVSDDGRFEIEIPDAGTYQVTYSSSDQRYRFQSERTEVSGAHMDIAIALHDFGGVLTDEAGTPLGGVRVGLGENLRRHGAVQYSDADGRFQFADVPPGSYVIGFGELRDGLGVQPSLVRAPESSGRTWVASPRLRQIIEIENPVFDDEGSTRLLVPGPRSIERELARFVGSRAEVSLPPGKHRVCVQLRRGDYVPYMAESVIDVVESNEIHTLRLRPSGRLGVFCADTGGRTVTADVAITADGQSIEPWLQFRIGGGSIFVLPVGVYRVSARADGGTAETEVVVVQGEESGGVRLLLGD